MRKLFGVTVVAALAAPAAFAGGAVQPAKEPSVGIPPVVAPVSQGYDWTGPYAGVTLGYGRADWSADPANTVAGGEDSSAGAAVHAGYNMDMGAWVTGMELELAPGAIAEFDTDDYEFDWGARLKLRGGPKLGADGRTFAYGTIGLGIVRTTDTNTDDTYTDTGWSAGIGVAHAFTDNMFVSGEVSHSRFNDVADTTSDVRGNAATLGVSLRF